MSLFIIIILTRLNIRRVALILINKNITIN